MHFYAFGHSSINDYYVERWQAMNDDKKIKLCLCIFHAFEHTRFWSFLDYLISFEANTVYPRFLNQSLIRINQSLTITSLYSFQFSPNFYFSQSVEFFLKIEYFWMYPFKLIFANQTNTSQYLFQTCQQTLYRFFHGFLNTIVTITKYIPSHILKCNL